MNIKITALAATALLGVVATFTTATGTGALETFTNPSPTIELAGDPSSPVRPIVLSEIDPESSQAEELIEAIFFGPSAARAFALSERDGSRGADNGVHGLAAPTLACGDALPIPTPDGGVQGNGCAATWEQAVLNAIADAVNNIAAFGDVNCEWCPVKGQCLSYTLLIDSQWELVDLVLQPDGSTCAVVAYKGPLLSGCTSCTY